MYADAVLIIVISVLTALLSEGTSVGLRTAWAGEYPTGASLGITWVLVYRTDQYKRLKLLIEKQSKRCKISKMFLNRNSGLAAIRFSGKEERSGDRHQQTRRTETEN